jgi:hypothetical protein
MMGGKHGQLVKLSTSPPSVSWLSRKCGINISQPYGLHGLLDRKDIPYFHYFDFFIIWGGGGFDAYGKNIFLLLIVVPHYKIIPACNTWHTFALSGVLKHLETQKHKIQSLVFCLLGSCVCYTLQVYNSVY